MRSVRAFCQLLVVALLSLEGSVGCSDTTLGLVPLPQGQLFGQLVLNDHAITMALTPPYDTLQLRVTPLSALGTPLADTSPTTWTVAYGDTNVKVSATGLLKAIGADANVVVYASRTIGGETLTDSAFINVNDTTPVPVADSIVMSFVPGDSARQSISSLLVISLPNQLGFSGVVIDKQGATIPNVQMSLTSSNAKVAPMKFFSFNGNFGYSGGNLSRQTLSNVGQSLLSITATVYGKTLHSQMVYTVGWPLYTQIVINEAKLANGDIAAGFSPQNDTVAAGGTVAWDNLNSIPADVVFDDSVAVKPGDSLYYFTQSSLNVIPIYDSTFIFQHYHDTGNIPAFVDDSIRGCYYFSSGILQRGVCPAGIRANTRTFYFNRARSFPTVGTYHYHSTRLGIAGVLVVLPPFQVPQLSSSP